MNNNKQIIFYQELFQSPFFGTLIRAIINTTIQQSNTTKQYNKAIQQSNTTKQYNKDNRAGKNKVILQAVNKKKIFFKKVLDK